jgi:pentapeptide MXKDX repeat protein
MVRRAAFGRPTMYTRLFTTFASVTLIGISLVAGGASAQSSMDSMKKPDSMKSNMTKTDNMMSGSMKANSMKMGGTKADCMHQAGMENDSMKKADMMKHCDAMK